MRVRFGDAVQNPLCGILVEDNLARPIVDMNNLNSAPPSRFEPGDVVTGAFEFPAVMAQGRHRLTATVARAGTGEHVMDRRERLASVLVHPSIPTIGTALTPFAVRFERHGKHPVRLAVSRGVAVGGLPSGDPRCALGAPFGDGAGQPLVAGEAGARPRWSSVGGCEDALQGVAGGVVGVSVLPEAHLDDSAPTRSAGTPACGCHS